MARETARETAEQSAATAARLESHEIVSLSQVEVLQAMLARSEERFALAMAKSDERMAALAEAITNKSQPGDASALGIPKERQNELLDARYQKPQRYRRILGRSEDTGATFEMVVVESKTYPNGRICRLEKYTHPDAAMRPQSAGGMVPDGLTIHAVVNQTGGAFAMHTVQYKQWRYETFWQADIRNIVGKGLMSRWCVDDSDIANVPWETSNTYQSDSAA